MRKRQLTEFGKDIKRSLIDLNRTQEWLISELKSKTGLYMDSSLLYRIMTGTVNNPKWEAAIKEILKL